MTRRIASRVFVGICIAVVMLGVRAVVAKGATCPTRPADTGLVGLAGAELQVYRLRQEVAESCAAQAEFVASSDASLQSIASNTASDGSPQTVAGEVVLTGDSQIALEDVRQVLAWTFGLIASSFLVLAFYRTFNTHTDN
jgi:hypothetical protein